jgi:hypothetical protein
MRELMARIPRAAQSDLSAMMILGETGTGKEVTSYSIGSSIVVMLMCWPAHGVEQCVADGLSSFVAG